MTKRKVLLTLFVLANLLLGYPFYYVLGYAVFNGIIPLLGYILLVVLINYFLIRLLKGNWIFLAFVAVALFFPLPILNIECFQLMNGC